MRNLNETVTEIAERAVSIARNIHWMKRSVLDH